MRDDEDRRISELVASITGEHPQAWVLIASDLGPDGEKMWFNSPEPDHAVALLCRVLHALTAHYIPGRLRG